MALRKVVRKKPTPRTPPGQDLLPLDKSGFVLCAVPGVVDAIDRLVAATAGEAPENGGDNTDLIKAIESHAMAIRDHANVLQGNTDAINRVADALDGIIAPTPGKATRITLTSVEDEPPHGGS